MIPPDRRWIAGDIAHCFAFFTRLPVPGPGAGGRGLGQAIWAAPVVGAAVGLIGAFVYALAFLTGLSGSVTAALALGAMLLVTGCLHEDGLSDVADGFGGGVTRERKLAIMRDSRIGTFGAVALFLSLLLRWGAISDLDSPVNVFFGLIAAQVASRALLPALMYMLPPARSDGLSAGAGEVPFEVVAGAAGIGTVASILFLGLAGLLPAVLCLAIVFFAFAHLCLKQIGGHTGDTLGALQQAGEITVLVVAAAVFY